MEGKTLNTLVSGVIGLSMMGASAAYASHLGPIEFGKPRTEKYRHCYTKDAAMRLADEIENSRTQNYDGMKLITVWRDLVKTGKCAKKTVTYTPLQLIRSVQGGRITRNKKYNLVRGKSSGKEIYIFTRDPIGGRSVKDSNHPVTRLFC